jgi:predicted porin
MKKSLIALAALAASSAFAQSSVTLYGLANIGFQSTNGSKAALTGGADGSDSRWGFRGTEDLGGGLSANFTFEAGFKPDTGTVDNTASQTFQRQSWISLASKDLGEVRLGRQYTVGFYGSIGTMPSTYTDPALAAGLGFNGMGSRTNDQIQYRSTSFGGFSVLASTQLAGDTTQAATAAAKNNELGLAYTNGPLTANLTTASVTSTTGVKNSPVGANATYNFGSFAATLGYVDTDSAKGKGTVAKINVPVGSHALYVGYAKNDTTKADAYELGDFYSLSKRTRLYALYANGNGTGAAAANGKRVALGVTHAF